MPRFAAEPDTALLVKVIKDPTQLSALDPLAWSRLLDAAEHARLLGWLLNQAEARGVPSQPPSWLADRLVAATRSSSEYDRAVRWEVDRIDRALRPSGRRWLLLKGAAYLTAGLSPGRGRRVADIDILVAEPEIREVESELRAFGWVFPEMTAYDERFYREWMHELPPMVHPDRESIVDVHHAILPKTSRLQPSSARLLAQAVEVRPGIRVLCPAHMVLHSAAHLFHDGEIAGAIRDLVDLDGLLRHFAKSSDFWPSLLTEARALGLTRPAYYAVHHTRRMLDTPVPPEVLREMHAWAPPAPVAWLMTAFIERAVQGQDRPSASVSAFALYVRSHWLKMPPLLLTRHLFRKAFS